MSGDYTPGDPPVQVGTLVHYQGARYRVEEHRSPSDHPNPPPVPALAEAYPDGVAYFLWPEGMPRKMGNAAYSRVYVRRTSFWVVRDE